MRACRPSTAHVLALVLGALVVPGACGDPQPLNLHASAGVSPVDGLSNTTNTTCAEVRRFPAAEQCALARTHCSFGSMIEYTVIYYCQFQGNTVLWTAAAGAWLLLLLALLGTTADEYFCDCISSVQHLTRMPVCRERPNPRTAL